ncbi:unnamed protein product (macronuclear) [Paramecium tetraurelia]|uniref:Uncharacterized protein n=1 Tax=Paramecium tetraurelia TaxID=5888 RepID=A0C076_PARTE|nr:uncharacterized protein GSPATT00006046001 [Paramecium tetraurelia]CAK64193.1 unnamed protein product [Paramecium tetraurelia]|eukprot:XP_001431591.1 hypothetical protein (macronuclear) [Paramecium tetraurelia strain d4-2]
MFYELYNYFQNGILQKYIQQYYSNQTIIFFKVMKMNVELNENQIADSKSMPLNFEPLIGIVCQELDQICTTSIQIKTRIIQVISISYLGRKEKEKEVLFRIQETKILLKIQKKQNNVYPNYCQQSNFLTTFNMLKNQYLFLDDQLIIYGF